MSEENTNSLDILIVGGKGVGKSSLFLRYLKGCRPDTPPPTSEFIFESKVVNLPRESVKLNIWDTSGMEEFNETLCRYCQGVDGILLVYDVTEQKSLENLGKWLSKLDKLSKKRNVKKMLVANKKDKNFVREISIEEGMKFAKKIRATYLETSAKNGENVGIAFENLVQNDPSGLEKFRSMLPNYYRSAHGVILVYDVTNPKSFEELEYWLTQISEHSKRINVKKMVVGNKTDLDHRQISEEEGCNFAQENGTSYMETSAKENCNVVIAFEHLVQQILLTPGLCERQSRDSRIQLTVGVVSNMISKQKQATSHNCC